MPWFGRRDVHHRAQVDKTHAKSTTSDARRQAQKRGTLRVGCLTSLGHARCVVCCATSALRKELRIKRALFGMGEAMPVRIGLVAQPKLRRGGICQAREQFGPSALFRRARDYCEREHSEWYIISTSHGLVPPHQVIGPHAPHLHMMTLGERAQWAARIAEQLRERSGRSAAPVTFALYTSRQFAALIMHAAPELDFELPLSGLKLRQRVKWYDERLHVRPRMLSRSHTTLVTT